MLGFLRGIEKGVAREGAAQRDYHSTVLSSKENHLDRLLAQIKYNQQLKRQDRAYDRSVLESDRTHQYRQDRDARQDFVTDRAYDRSVLESDRTHQYRQDRAEAADAQFDAVQALRERADTRAGEVHNFNYGENGMEILRKNYFQNQLNEYEANEPLRTLTRQYNEKLMKHRSGTGWDNFIEMEGIGLEQAEANLANTKARTWALRNPRTSTTGAGGSFKMPTATEMQKWGSTSPLPSAFLGAGERPFWFDKKIPWDAPTGETSYKTLASDAGMQVGSKAFRDRFPVDLVSPYQIRGAAADYWQGLLQTEIGQEFIGKILEEVPAEQQAARMEDARRQFMNNVYTGFYNPPAPLTVDSSGMGGIEIDPGMVNTPTPTTSNPWATEQLDAHTQRLKDAYTDPNASLGDVSSTPSVDEMVGGLVKGWLSRRGARGSNVEGRREFFDNLRKNQLQGSPVLTPSPPSATPLLPGHQQEAAIRQWQLTGEMDWAWFDALPDDAKVKMYGSLPDFQQQDFRKSYEFFRRR